TKEAISSVHEESEKSAKASQAAAVENLQSELPRWLAPQLEQLTQQLTAQLSKEAQAHREEHERRLREAEEALKRAKNEAEAASQK
ncbi:hypothetical protein, partial [Pseudomonas sp. FW306-2-11AD]|uniref:hypothetical protein n=1 Tax=Pseudomonas sp. FW306-2-11AD TaxID=2070665 RepID=UPI000CAE8828